LGRAPSRLDVPRRYQGEFFGHGRELAPGYEALGLSGRAVRYVDAREFVLV
jgi:hypothetical protein